MNIDRNSISSTRAQQVALFFLAALLVGLGFIAGWFSGTAWFQTRIDETRGVELRLPGYTFINPLLECEISGSSRQFTELQPFRNKVDALLKRKTADYKLSHVSVYFRDLTNGPWFGINEQEKFAPASLLKVPTMIACLKQAERKPGFLSKRIRYQGDRDYNAQQTIQPLDRMKPGNSYTIDQLLYRSIAQSDNNANVLLFNAVDKKLLAAAYRALGVEPPTKLTADDYLSVKAYASFFRVLYNASYLSREMSHKALTLLAESDFKEGIVAGVPSTIAVAQKFGERVHGAADDVKQLHDCGIVYYPGNPYLLCIMSRGADLTMLDDIIRDVSRLVYEEVDAQLQQGRNKKASSE